MGIMKWTYFLWCMGLGLQLAGEATVAQISNKGTLLVAREDLPDPRFSETVVLLVQHDSGGALGIVLNRPTWVEPTIVFPELEFLSDYEGHVYIGGPLQQSNILILARRTNRLGTDAMPVLEGVYASSELDFLRLAADSAKDESALRLYAGHAEWGPQQLDQEIARGDWRVIPAKAEMVFTSEPLTLWRRARSSELEMIVNQSDSELPIALVLN